MSNRTFSAKIVAQKPALSQQLERCIELAGDIEVMEPENKKRPDILIYELSGDLQEAFDLIHTMLDTNQVDAVFLTSVEVEATVLLKALQTGISGFFTQPLNEGEVVAALNKFKDKQFICEEPPILPNGRIVYLLGSKGGAGTTTLGVNMATLLSNSSRKLKVVLLDMNMLLGDIPLFIELDYTCSITEVIDKVDRLDHAFLQACLTEHPSGLKVLPSPRFLNEQTILTPETMERILTLLSSMFDFVLIDGGKTIDTTHKEMMRMAGDIFLVTQLDLPALSNARKLIDLFRYNKLDDSGKLKVIVTRHSRKSHISIKEAKEALTEDVYWTVPDDERVCFSALNQGRPINEIAPRSKIGKNLDELCKNYLQQVLQ